MAQPGWYADPHGGGGQRWWDGARWSEHTIPPPPAPSPPGVIPPPPSGAPPAGTAPAGPTFVPAPGDPAPAIRPAAAVPSLATASRPGADAGAGSGGRPPKLLLVLLALVFVVAIGAVVAFLLGDDAEEAVDPSGVGRITAGEERPFTVPDDGEWELVIEVPAGQLVIDARGIDEFDPVATLFDAAGRELASNDDRSSGQQDRYGGGTFDALIEQEIPTAGSYRVVITGFAGQGGSGQVSFPVVGG
jgi:hypothetical protein